MKCLLFFCWLISSSCLQASQNFKDDLDKTTLSSIQKIELENLSYNQAQQMFLTSNLGQFPEELIINLVNFADQNHELKELRLVCKMFELLTRPMIETKFLVNLYRCHCDAENNQVNKLDQFLKLDGFLRPQHIKLNHCIPIDQLELLFQSNSQITSLEFAKSNYQENFNRKVIDKACQNKNLKNLILDDCNIFDLEFLFLIKNNITKNLKINIYQAFLEDMQYFKNHFKNHFKNFNVVINNVSLTGYDFTLYGRYFITGDLSEEIC